LGDLLMGVVLKLELVVGDYCMVGNIVNGDWFGVVVVFEVGGELFDDFLVEDLDGELGLGRRVHGYEGECYKENYLSLFF
jgi:hypothetical protein